MTVAMFDSDVVLDVLLRREPHSGASAAALDTVAQGGVDGLLAAHAVTTISDILARQIGARQSRGALATLLSRLQVAAVTDAVVREALISPLADFEDAVCDAAARDAGAAVIVTRNVADFAGSRVPALLPVAFLALLRAKEQQ